MSDGLQIISEEITLSELENRISDPYVDDVFVDIRSLQEFEQGHIKDFKNCPFDDLKNHLYIFDQKNVIITSNGDPEKEAQTVNTINSNPKVKSILVFDGGIDAWHQAQKALVMGND